MIAIPTGYLRATVALTFDVFLLTVFTVIISCPFLRHAPTPVDSGRVEVCQVLVTSPAILVGSSA